MTGQTVISIGAGAGQAPLIRAARNAGFQVVGIDRDDAPAARAWLARHIRHSTHDADGAVLAAQVACGDGISVRAVLARASGPAVVTAARVAEVMGVHGVSMAFARASLSKSVLREQAAALGIAVPVGVVVARPTPPNLPRPWVVKPDQPVVGKKNVRLVRDADAFPPAFEAARGESVNGLVEVETYIDGVDVGYGALMRDGCVVRDLLYDEYTLFHDGRAAGLGVGAPSRLAGGELENRARAAAQTLFGAWGMANGFAFLTFRVDRTGGLHVYEANPGLCGDQIADRLLPCVWPGFDPFAAEVAALTGRELAPSPVSVPAFCAVLTGRDQPVRDVAELGRALASMDGGAAWLATMEEVCGGVGEGPAP
ncbi:MAG: hypothetical protein HQL36_10440 [Alphaproteobacteria bacterium]|nr:hypothetical protein [Alphaproteobacteria bacterium]MBF0249283.1 hypothetical protein [Alphaproteobacteria bacterium]